ncbi:MAG: HAF repeat-containing protein [Isosphaeraceae bacterium]
MWQRVWSIGVAGLLWCVASRADDPSGKLQIVTPRDDEIIATGMNGRGDIVGFQWEESKQYPGVVDQVPIYVKGKAITRLPLLKGYTATFPAAVSDDGVVVGRAGKPAPPGVFVPLRNQAFVWDAAGGIRPLGVLEGDAASFASDITADGRRISGFSVGENRVRACYWERAGDGWKATALPHDAQLGSNVVPMSEGGKRIASVMGSKPCLWTEEQPGRWKHEFLGEPGSFVPRGVNDAGMVVGVRFTQDGLLHAMAWTREKGLIEIPRPEGYAKAEANGVNNAGVVVGMIDGPGGSKIGPNAFVYASGKLRILEEGGPNFTSAVAINDRGQVTGVFEKPEEEEQKPPAGTIRAEPKEPVKAPRPER